MPTFATLGPDGSNHQLVTGRYIAFHNVAHAQILLVRTFEAAIELLLTGTADYIVQAAVHPEASDTVARAYFRHKIYVVDTFIAPSHSLGILTRIDVLKPKCLALQPATREYVDASRWQTLVPEISIASVAEGLLEGRYDSGLTRLDLADRYPGRFRVDETIGTIDDPWIVYGKQQTCRGDLLACKDSPVAQQLRRM